MKFTFKRTGHYTWAMGNKIDEKGSFFETDCDCFDVRKIIKDYGCSVSDGRRIYGLAHSHELYLFVPENVYPIINIMFEEIKTYNKDKNDFFHEELERKKKEKKLEFDKISQWIDPNITIEV